MAKPDRTVVTGIRYSALKPFKRMAKLWNKPVLQILSDFIDTVPREHWEQFVEEGQVEADKRNQGNKEKLKRYILER